MDHRYNLERFLSAQETCYDKAFSEIKNARLVTPCVKIIFPSMRFAAHTAYDCIYSFSDREEAKAYIDHPVLGQRLKDLALLLTEHESNNIRVIFPYAWDISVHECMTLFACLSDDPWVFYDVIVKYFGAMRHHNTLYLIGEEN